MSSRAQVLLNDIIDMAREVRTDLLQVAGRLAPP
jgi:hypothetical protein